MTIIDSSNKKQSIDLRGPNGNCFVILGAASKLGKQLGFSKEKLKEMQSEMMSADYENLIRIFDEHFGEYVDLIR
jgi:hypothetical protein